MDIVCVFKGLYFGDKNYNRVFNVLFIKKIKWFY